MKKLITLALTLILVLSLTACGGKSSKSVTIAVPNDTTNEARALMLLENLGYLKLKEGAGITMDNLGDYTIGVQRGTTGHIYTEDDFGDQVVAYDTYTLVFQALNNGQVDCIVMDDAVAKAYLATNPGLTMTETTYEPEEYAFGFHKGNEALVDAVNAVLEELIADGTVQSIVDKYMSE